MLRLHPADCLVRHISGEVVIRIMGRLDADGSVKNCWRPLIGFAADEAIELVEAGVSRPAVIGAGNGYFPRRSLMILPESSGAVSVQAKHFCQRRYIVRPDAGVAWKCGRKFHDGAGVVHVMIATGEQRGARGRTERTSVKGVVL